MTATAAAAAAATLRAPEQLEQQQQPKKLLSHSLLLLHCLLETPMSVALEQRRRPVERFFKCRFGGEEEEKEQVNR